MAMAANSVETGVHHTHLRGRTYEVKCDAGYRPIQIPRKCIVASYEGEVTLDNADKYNLMWIDEDLLRRYRKLVGDDTPEGCDLTFNEVLERVVNYLEMEVEAGPDPARTSWLPVSTPA
jgi:hypothetical protein